MGKSPEALRKLLINKRADRKLLEDKGLSGRKTHQNVLAHIKFLEGQIPEATLSRELSFDNANKNQYGSRSLNLMKNKIEQTPILNKNAPERKLTDKQLSARIRNKLAENKERFPDIFNPKESVAEPISKRNVFDKRDITKNKGNPSGKYTVSSSDTDKVEQQDEETNVLEKFVSKLIGRNIQFKDIPDDDPDFDVGYKSEGHFAYPAGRPDLKKGGMTAKSAATTEFKKPLGMKGGGLTRSQKQRIARLTQEYKQKKARKSNGKRTNR